MEVFLFLFIWRASLCTFLELQQLLIILADLLCHDNLLAFSLFLNLTEDLLPWVKKNLFEILHITFFPLHGVGLEFGGFFLFDGLKTRSLLGERLHRRINFKFGFFSGIKFDG